MEPFELKVISKAPPKLGLPFLSRYSDAEIAAARLKNCNIPKRFEGACFDNFSASCIGSRNAMDMAVEYVKNFDDHLSQGRSMIFSGTVGSGKTHLACAIAKTIIGSHPMASVLYTTAYNMIQAVKGTWSNKEGPAEQKVLDKFTRPTLVVIDELGAHTMSDSDRAIFFSIMNDLYESMKPSIVISNANLEGIKDCIGDRVFDRLREKGGKIVLFTWNSRRK